MHSCEFFKEIFLSFILVLSKMVYVNYISDFYHKIKTNLNYDISEK